MNYYFLAFEIVMIALLIFCLVHAWKRSYLDVLKIVGGVCFGLLLEWATIQQTQSYTYGTFPLMIAEVPVAIGIGWGVIIYSAGLFSDLLAVKPWMRPVIDAFLALNIDMAMDTVAIRLGMWNWGIPMEAQFFGVKWGNFWGWFWVVCGYSAAFRILSKSKIKALRLASPLLSIIIGTACVLVTNHIIKFMVPDEFYHVVVIVFLTGTLGYTLLQRPKLTSKVLTLPIVAVPLAFHAYFLLAGIISGTIFQPVYILFISIAMILVAAWLHRHRLFASLIK